MRSSEVRALIAHHAHTAPMLVGTPLTQLAFQRTLRAVIRSMMFRAPQITACCCVREIRDVVLSPTQLVRTLETSTHQSAWLLLTLADGCQLRLKCDQLWPHLAEVGQLWPDVHLLPDFSRNLAKPTSAKCRSTLAKVGQDWSTHRPGIGQHRSKVSRNWPTLVASGQLWPNLAISGYIWATSSIEWPSWAKPGEHGQTSPEMSSASQSKGVDVLEVFSDVQRLSDMSLLSRIGSGVARASAQGWATPEHVPACLGRLFEVRSFASCVCVCVSLRKGQ